MASQCKRQQCTIDRRSFRQELESWRHKLINCVGFESILEGLFGPRLVEDLKIFKEPIQVSDWSFDENCLFCCLRRDKVKEHLFEINNKGPEDSKRFVVKDQATISRLEKQAEEFLSAVLCRKDVPNFTDPHIPIVAREILQRMIRQFAAEYTSKTSSSQDSCLDNQSYSDQSLTSPTLASSPAATLVGSAHNQNPVLSKLLMDDQDAPLDLTIKKPLAESSGQDGVLDLSVKKNRYSSGQHVRSPCLSPATTTLKGESPDLRIAKAKDLQSTSTLEQFMAKLCPHHQRQIVDAIGFLQTEVKALASSNTQQGSNSTSGLTQGTACSSLKSIAVTPEKSNPELQFTSESTPKTELQEVPHSTPISCAKKTVPETAVSLKTSVSVGSGLDLCSSRSGNSHAFVTPAASPVDTENNRHGDHAPLKMKIMASNVADGKKLSCVLNASLSTHDTLDDRRSNSNSSNKMETLSARLSSSVKRNNQASHTFQARQKESIGHAKDTAAKVISVHVTIPSDSPRTARKTIRTSSDRTRGVSDPDLAHCDIVFIDKPITECFKEERRSMVPRRNARKSTRGHMYSDEIWELKTVRTLAGRGNCPNPMPELTTLITPKQILSKPEGLPPVDMPFVGPCRETINQQLPPEESDESVIPGTGDMVEMAASEDDVIVETSQTDQCLNKGQPSSPAPLRSSKQNNETDKNPIVEQDTDKEMTMESKEDNIQASFKADIKEKHELQEEKSNSAGQKVAENLANPLENITLEEPEPLDAVQNNQPVLQQTSASSSPPAMNQVEEERNENKFKELHDDKISQEVQQETDTQSNVFGATENSNTTSLPEEPLGKDPGNKTLEPANGTLSLESEEKVDYDVSSKTLDALLKELPPWRRKRGTAISLPKRLIQTETVIVGYVNGRPISASDRSLRRRSGNSTMSPNENPVNSSQDVRSQTSKDFSVSSNVENQNLDKPLPKTDINTNISEATAVIDQGEPLSGTTSSDANMTGTKQTKKQKRGPKDQDTLPVCSDPPVDSSPSTESTRQLRSASQRPAVSPISPPTLHTVTSGSSPKPTDTNELLPTEQLFPFPLASPVLDTSPPQAQPSPTEASEQCQQDIGTTVILDIEKAQLVETTSDEIDKNYVSNGMPAKQKLRSAKVVEDNKSEKQESISEESNALENQSPVNTEMQAQTPLRSKRILRKDTCEGDFASPQKPNVASLEDRPAADNDSSPSLTDTQTRMPLRSESSKTENTYIPISQPTLVDNKKLALRSAVPFPSAVTITGRRCGSASPIRIMSERVTKAQVKSSPVSLAPVLSESLAITPRSEPPKQTVNRFFETLTGEESQHLISNLNVKYDKMQKGWVQMDKEGQPAPKYKSKADRQAAIWKSKRRARKPKSSEYQKYSPVQMLFMKSFSLSSICRWFIESTETKSLVIVKKVNTRLPSETQLCFHSSSSSGTSQGVFPSLQAERLKKHLKKFPIASPVKSNPKSLKLIAKALEQDASAMRGKELSSATKILTKSRSSPQTCIQISESQKTSGKSKNPASARILRKYSNIRGKMQVQQTNARLKKASKTLKNSNIKRLTNTKSTARSSLKAQKSNLRVRKQMKASVAKLEKGKKLDSKKNTKHPVQERGVRVQSSSKASRDATKKELPKRCSQRLGSPKISDNNSPDASKTKADRKQLAESQKVEMEKPSVNKMNAAQVQTKESPQSTQTDIKCTQSAVEIPQQIMDVKAAIAPDQVLTRSQRKMEGAYPKTGTHSQALKRAAKSVKTRNASPKSARKAEEHTLTRSGALKSPMKRSQAALMPRHATKRAQELLETPAKRTRTSLTK